MSQDPHQQQEVEDQDATPPRSNQEDDGGLQGADGLEVYHNEGATDLFLAVEDANWRHALQIIHNKPAQAKVWVISTGTGDAAFSWSLWKRLPLHEACRRQAPAWLISALISAHPEACEQTTQFGELPLHLAVECGAPPEVVNLLVVAYWHGISVQDQSGRTPLEILQDSEMLAMEDHQVVFESLSRSRETYETIHQNHASSVKDIQDRHAAGLAAIRQQHDEDIQQEQEQQDKLLAEVERLRSVVDDAKTQEQKHLEQFRQLSQVASSQKSTLVQLDATLEDMTTSNSQKGAQIVSLEESIAQKNAQISALQNQVKELQGDLHRMAGWQQDVLSQQINQTEESMQTMVEHFVGMVDLLSGQEQRLMSLLKTRNVPIPAPGSTGMVKKSPRRKGSEEKKTDVAVLDDDTLSHIAAAASNALQVE